MLFRNVGMFLLLLGGCLSKEIVYENTSDLEEILLKSNDTHSRRAGGQIIFEDDPVGSNYNDLSDVSLDEPGHGFRFEDSPYPGGSGNHVTFQDDNRIEVSDTQFLNSGDVQVPAHVAFIDENRGSDPGPKRKRRRRRRRPRYQLLQSPYNPGAPMPPGFYSEYPGPPYVGAGQGFPPGPRPIGQYYRPHRRPKQSFASEALSKVAGALSSIALYDDYQCVPRLLCEAAGGGALGSSPVLQSIAGLQPLLTLLSAYNGISTSPLFVFGRAVFLGMTSKGNTASCRYAYPQCPTDPEQLVHYLNNHNGGFFRFFNSPQPQIPQNVEQFYNQLSEQYGFQNLGSQQNYGLYDPQNQVNQNPNQQYGFYQQNVNPQLNSQNQPFGLYQPYPQNLGHPSGPNYGFYEPGSTSSCVKIENRIQNKPSYLYVDSNVGNVDVNSKWIFPENSVKAEDIKVFSNNVRGGKNLKFPEESNTIPHVDEDDRRKGKSILFPESQRATYVNYYEYPPVYSNANTNYSPNPHIIQNNNIGVSYVSNYDPNVNTNYVNHKINTDSTNFNGYAHIYNNVYNNDNGYGSTNTYSKYMYNSEDEDGVRTVYIVRGNGDPNNPEILKIRPGERVMV